MRNTDQTAGFATRAIHHAYDPLDHGGSLVPPVHMTSTFVFDRAETGGAIFAGEAPGHVYSRISNPTLDLLEQRMASLEGAEAGVATGSGIGAITSSLWTLVAPGDASTPQCSNSSSDGLASRTHTSWNTSSSR